MILSFAYTEKEFLSGDKTETRRNWKPRTLRMWQKAWDEGRLIHDAVNRGLHRGGRRIGKLKLTARPDLEALRTMTAANLKAEGGMCATVKEFCKLVKQRPSKRMVVVRFQRLNDELKHRRE